MVKMICPEALCTGCSACVTSCRNACIHMVPDAEGFLRPSIDESGCDDCGACRAVCPMLHLSEPDLAAEPNVYASWNNDADVRFRSASGGVFSALAEYVLGRGGVVFGAAFDENMVVRHIAIRRIDEIDALRGSKYVQSDIGDAYEQVCRFLKQGNLVLFSGTPCQVAGLYATLGGRRECLLTCDLVCKGVPSPGVFAKYVKAIEERYCAEMTSINFRHKRLDWQIPSTVVYFDDGCERVLTGLDDSYMHGFAHSLTLRPVCYQCPYKTITRKGDLTLGDFWGIGQVDPFAYDTKNGVSIILVNSHDGGRLLEETDARLVKEERTLAEAKHRRTKLSHPIPEPPMRGEVFQDYCRLEYEQLAKLYFADPWLKALIKRVIPRRSLFHLRKLITKVMQR